MSLDQDQVRDFARTYTEAWCSHDPARVADHFTPGGMIAINGGEPTEITEVARPFMTVFPDIQVFMNDDSAGDQLSGRLGTRTTPSTTSAPFRIE